MTKYQIPDNALPAFTELSKLSTKETEKIGLLLQQFPLGGSIDDLQKSLNENQLFVDVPEMAETFFSFGSLLANNKETTNEELAKNLSVAFAEKKKDEVGGDIVEQLEKNLLTLFECADNLTKTMKAFNLLTENAHLYRQSSVMTDMRLLFNDELETAPACGVILHQLKIDYIENGEQKSFFLSMDKDDVTEMCNVLKRALKKEDIILKNQSDIHFITLK
jgi:hypothetical protein